jgi:hypothetical protein
MPKDRKRSGLEFHQHTKNNVKAPRERGGKERGRERKLQMLHI